MSRGCAWSVHAAVLLVTATGIVYGWLRYFGATDDLELGPVDHPATGDWQHAHVLAAPLLVFCCGLIWRAHVWARIRSGFAVRRRSGIALAVLLLPMVGSGYALQTAVDPDWRDAWIWIHVGASCLWAAVYLAHQCSRRRTPGPAP